MYIEHFLRCHVWTSADPAGYLKRVACIPFSNITYIKENVDFNSTDIYLNDGEIVVACLRYEIIMAAWQTFLDEKTKEMITFYRNN